MSYIDWSQAFDRQCPQLGIQSFINNGVRSEIIPVLINYFQNRKMRVKWHKKLSSERDLPGGGPQGSSTGILEYISQSTGNVDFLEEDQQYKYIDDLTVLEVINLISIGLTSYNFKSHVASDIGIDQLFLPTENTQSQIYLDKVQDWTQRNKMKLNNEKTKVMIFNESVNYQFSTRIHIEDTLLEIIRETKLLGLHLTSDLSWNKNTDVLVKKSYARMTILRKLYAFNIPVKDLVLIYITYIRSLLEQSCVVWHSSLTEGDSDKLERVQKVSLRIILKDSYQCYENARSITNLETLKERRSKLCLKFAKASQKNPFMSSMFPENDENSFNTRHHERYKVQFARTFRLYQSAVPYMQRLLNGVGISPQELAQP